MSPPAGREREGNLLPPAAQTHYEDLLRAVDAIVTKPGYGIVADVLAHRVPILHRPGDFAEYPRLVAALATAPWPIYSCRTYRAIYCRISDVAEETSNWPIGITEPVAAESSRDPRYEMICLDELTGIVIHPDSKVTLSIEK
jgi:hypothetical protein